LLGGSQVILGFKELVSVYKANTSGCRSENN